jgi:hypothetical protein
MGQDPFYDYGETALVAEGMVLVTADRMLMEYPVAVLRRSSARVP